MITDQRVPWVVANFKLNGSRHFFEQFVKDLEASRGKEWDPEGVHLVLCPPFPYLSFLTGRKGTLFEVGAQDCSLYPSGSFTGEVSAQMLRDSECQWVILGHNERRLWSGDTDERVVEKMRLAFEAGLFPLVCVGEPLEVRQAGRAVDFVAGQVSLLLKGCPPRATPAIAYEPLWAIGTGKTPSQGDIEEMHSALEILLRQRGERPPLLLYGGSVTPENGPHLLGCRSVSGGLVGRPCLDSATFVSLLKELAPLVA